MATAQTLSFRGAKRRGNPLNRNENTVAVATDRTCFRNYYRAENLCYQFEQGQKLLPQFRKIVCLVGAPSAQAENSNGGAVMAREVICTHSVRDIVAFGNSDICALRK